MLQRRYPKQVVFLLGNHEHAHLGGPVVGKFFTDEAARLEELLGENRSSLVRDWFQSWPLVALAPVARLCLLHAAPMAPLRSRAQLEKLPLSFEGSFDEAAMTQSALLNALLWARATTQERARAFLDALDPMLAVAIHGHDVVREGVAFDHDSVLCLSTSFGCHDGDKVYLDWDLSAPVNSTRDLLHAGALKRLWPTSTPVYLDERIR